MSPWEQVAKTTIEMLAAQRISAEEAASWLWTLLDFAEQAEQFDQAEQMEQAA